MSKKTNIDPALWTRRPAFGVAGGPLVVVLTKEGERRAFSVGAQCRAEAAEALEALARSGDGLLSLRDGHRLTPTDLGKVPQFIWGYLRGLGLVVSFQNDKGDGVSLTEAGCRAVWAGALERARLLERCEREAQS